MSRVRLLRPAPRSCAKFRGIDFYAVQILKYTQMKKAIYLAGIFLLNTYLSFGQANNLSKDTIKTKFKFLYIMRFADKVPVATENNFIDPMKVDSMDAVPDSASKEICRLLKIDGIIVLKIAPKTKVLTLNDVFDLYKIQSRYRKLLIKVDDRVRDYPETILISKNQIDEVKIVKRHYINIILKGYYKIKKEDKKGGIRII